MEWCWTKRLFALAWLPVRSLDSAIYRPWDISEHSGAFAPVDLSMFMQLTRAGVVNYIVSVVKPRAPISSKASRIYFFPSRNFCFVASSWRWLCNTPLANHSSAQADNNTFHDNRGHSDGSETTVWIENGIVHVATGVGRQIESSLDSGCSVTVSLWLNIITTSSLLQNAINSDIHIAQHGSSLAGGWWYNPGL